MLVKGPLASTWYKNICRHHDDSSTVSQGYCDVRWLSKGPFSYLWATSGSSGHRGPISEGPVRGCGTKNIKRKFWLCAFQWNTQDKFRSVIFNGMTVVPRTSKLQRNIGPIGICPPNHTKNKSQMTTLSKSFQQHVWNTLTPLRKFWHLMSHEGMASQITRKFTVCSTVEVNNDNIKALNH